MNPNTLELLETDLKKTLVPYYVLGSDEAVLLKEARALICKYAFNQGFTNRTVLDFHDHFAWDQLYHDSTMDLFQTRSIIELHCEKAVSDSTIRQFNHYLERFLQVQSSQHLYRLIILSIAQPVKVLQKAKWFLSVTQQTRPFLFQKPAANFFPRWLHQKLEQAQLQLTKDAFAQFVFITEGNLNAAHQQLEKLKLLAPTLNTTPITKEQINEWMQDQSQFELSTLSQAIYAGSCMTVTRIFDRLKVSNMEPILLLGYLMKLIRVFSALYYDLHIHNIPIAQLFKKHGIWSTQQAYFKKACARCRVEDLKNLFYLAHQIDRCIKGLERRSIWDDLETLSLNFTRYFQLEHRPSHNVNQ